MAPLGLRALLYGGVICAGVLAATSWTRERESGTWESLQLSLLRPREILRAKWFSPLISLAYYSAPLFDLMLLGAVFVGLELFVPALCVVGAWLGFASALGLWISWRARNGTAAIAWTLGLLMFLLAGLPWLNSVAELDQSLISWYYGVNTRPNSIFVAGVDIESYRVQLWAWHPGRDAEPAFSTSPTSRSTPRSNGEAADLTITRRL